MLGETPIPAAELSKVFKLPVARWLLERLLLADGVNLGLIDETGRFLEGVRDRHGIAGQLRIVHPIHLSADALDLWQDHFVTRGMEQPFPQLFRETYQMQPEEVGLSVCQRFVGVVLDCDKAVRQLTSLGWSAGRVDYPFFYKPYPDHGVRAALLPGDSIASFESGDDFLIDALSFSSIESDYFDHCGPLPLGEVAPVVFSEAIRDLTRIVPESLRGKSAR
jgi:hypothetical protein